MVILSGVALLGGIPIVMELHAYHPDQIFQRGMGHPVIAHRTL